VAVRLCSRPPLPPSPPKVSGEMASESRIRELCAQALEEKDREKFKAIADELKEALHEHINELRALVKKRAATHSR